MTSDRVIMTRALVRAALRATRRTVRETRVRPRAAPRQRTAPDGRTVVVQPVAARSSGAPRGLHASVVSCAGQRVGELWTRADLGTSTYEIVPRFDVGADVAVAATALRLVLHDARIASPELRPAVRCPLDPLVAGPDPAVLTDLGLTHVATFPGDPASPQAWAGEERWELVRPTFSH